MLRTGWDEQQLGRASRQTVDTLSWVLFAEQLRDDLGGGLDVVARDIDDAQFQLGKPSDRAKEARQRARVGEALIALGQARLHAVATRKVLWPPDDEEASGG